MRKLVYYIACSVDGFIAHLDGSHNGFSQDSDYLTDLFSAFPETVPSHLRGAMGLQTANRWFDTVLMGRKTYEIGLKEGITSPYSHLKQYLFSRSMTETLDPDVELVAQNAAQIVTALKRAAGENIWLCGGGTLATELLAHGLIDQMILKINPFLMGAGIPLFSETIQQSALKVIDSKLYDNGVWLVHYNIENSWR